MSTIIVDSSDRRINVLDYVHETSLGYVVAAWNERGAQYLAPMSARARRATGCHTVFARSLDDIASDPCVSKYATRSSAVRWLLSAYEFEHVTPAELERRREISRRVDREWREEQDRALERELDAAS